MGALRPKLPRVLVECAWRKCVKHARRVCVYPAPDRPTDRPTDERWMLCFVPQRQQRAFLAVGASRVAAAAAGVSDGCRWQRVCL